MPFNSPNTAIYKSFAIEFINQHESVKAIQYPSTEDMFLNLKEQEQTGETASFAYQKAWEEFINYAKELNITFKAQEHGYFILPSINVHPKIKNFNEQTGQISSFAFDLGFEKAREIYLNENNVNFSLISEIVYIANCQKCKMFNWYVLYDKDSCNCCKCENLMIVENLFEKLNELYNLTHYKTKKENNNAN